MFFKGNDTYIINSCETIEVFYNLRTDLDKLEAASQITKIISDVTTENQNSFRILQLFLNTLYTISESDKNIEQIIASFKLRLLSIIGFLPNVKECATCKAKENIEYFSFKDNGFKCNNCGRLDKSALSILPETAIAIKYIVSCDPKKIFSFSIPEESLKELKLISKLYLNEKLEKEYK